MSVADNGHTLITELAGSGAGDEVIMSIAGHVSRAMLSRYSHIRMEAKRRALDEIATRQGAADEKRKPECAVIRGTKNRQRIRPPRQTPRVIVGSGLIRGLLAPLRFEINAIRGIRVLSRLLRDGPS